jgi:hypothetical protein
MDKYATASFTIMDHGRQKSVVSVNMHNPAPGAGLDAIEADMNDIKLGIDALTTGSILKQNLHVTVMEEESTPATNSSRENKWLVTYKDTTKNILATPVLGNQGYGMLFSFEIPGADRAMLEPGTEELDLSDAYVATAIAHIEPNIRSPFNRAAAGLTPTNEIVSIRFVGRNL